MKLLLLFARFLSLPIFADAIVPGETPAKSSDGYFVWLVLGMLVVCIAASLWVYITGKKKK